MVILKEACAVRTEVADLVQVAFTVIDHLIGQYFRCVFTFLLVDLTDTVKTVIYVTRRQSVCVYHIRQTVVYIVFVFRQRNAADLGFMRLVPCVVGKRINRAAARDRSKLSVGIVSVCYHAVHDNMRTDYEPKTVVFQGACEWFSTRRNRPSALF